MTTNLCKDEKVIHTCTASCHKEQKECSYYLPGTNPKCLFYQFDEYCTSISAHDKTTPAPITAPSLGPPNIKGNYEGDNPVEGRTDTIQVRRVVNFSI